jgi:UDP-N-acetylmuramoyl-tripeptide--D-alanyl-D-alanine ligase
MTPTHLDRIAGWAGATIAGADPGTAATALVAGVGSDTRSFRPGDLFAALSGEHFDGHGFVAAAAAAGAAAALVSREIAGLPAGFPQLVVPDVLAALQRLAAAYRRQLPARVVGVTGSNGKTTTKEFCAVALGTRFRVGATRGNLNNHIGVPLTLLSLGAEDEAAVIEMGMNHPGEIAPLAAMAAPQTGVITNIGIAHIEHLGSREAIAEEKGALARALPPDGCLVLDAEDDFSAHLAAQTAARKLTTGFRRGDLRAESIRAEEGGSRFEVVSEAGRSGCFLPVPGEHMVRNALLAIAAAVSFGIPPEEAAAALAGASAGKGRLQRREVRGVAVIDDSYNANPDSMLAALETVSKMPGAGRRIAVLGQMNELGERSRQAHGAVGEAAARLADALLTVGPVAAEIARAAEAAGLRECFALGSAEEAAGRLAEMAEPGDLVLVKGSRGARMERVIEAFERGEPARAGASAP